MFNEESTGLSVVELDRGVYVHPTKEEITQTYERLETACVQIIEDLDTMRGILESIQTSYLTTCIHHNMGILQ